ncbi:hypothetical protein ACVNPZ_10460 [Staphylococcus aureus]
MNLGIQHIVTSVEDTEPSNSSDYTIFVAEVASTCNEALLSDYMDKHLDDEKRLLLLNREN